MKRSMRHVLVLLFCLALPVGAAAAVSVGSLTVYPATGPIVLDGFADDWAVGGLEPTIRVHPDVSTVNSGAIADAKELSADIYLLYDDENVYVTARVTDDNIVGYAVGGNIWTNSGVELWFSFSGIPADPAAYGAYTAADYQINLSPMTAGMIVPGSWVYPASHSHHNSQHPVAVASSLWTQEDAQGYLIEAIIPKALYPGFEKVESGSTFRFAVSMMHHDKTDGTREHVWTPAVEYLEVTVQ